MKSKEDKLDVDEWIAVPVDLSKPNDAVKKDVVKKDVYNADIKKNIEDKIPDISNFSTNATNASLNAKINEVKGEIQNGRNFWFKIKTSKLSKQRWYANLVKKTDFDSKLKMLHEIKKN